MRGPKRAFPEGWLTLCLGKPGGLHILSLVKKAPEGGIFIPLHSFHLRGRGPVPEPIPSTGSGSISPSSLFHIPSLWLDLILGVPLINPSFATGC